MSRFFINLEKEFGLRPLIKMIIIINSKNSNIQNISTRNSKLEN